MGRSEASGVPVTAWLHLATGESMNESAAAAAAAAALGFVVLHQSCKHYKY